MNIGTWPTLAPKNHQLLAIIQSLLNHSDGISLLLHAQDRMVERGITMSDILYVLEHGEIDGKISAADNEGEWQCKICDSPRFPENNRDIGVVTIVIKNEKILIKTVEWEDLS